MRLLVRSGRVVTPHVDTFADLVCEDGRITAWHDPGRGPPAADEFLDARGLIVLPGLIDPHVHSRDPGQTSKETFLACTHAAAASGITTLLEMPNAVPPVLDGAGFRDRVAYLSERAHVDFGLWGLALDASSASRMAELSAQGAVAVKVFWGFAFDRQENRLAYSFPESQTDRFMPPLSPAGLLEVLEAAAEHDLLVGVHCEDRSVLELMQRRHPSYDDYNALNRSRPVIAEALSVAMLAELAAHTGARVHVLHISSGQATDVARAAQRRGIRITAETCPHYLALTASDFATIGAAMKIYPPIRTQRDQDALWQALVDGVVSSVGSDHAPHAEQERDGPLDAQPAGGRGVHATVPVLLDAVHRGRLTLPQLAERVSEATARLYGLYPRKGALLPGSDADMTIVDMERSWVLRGPSGGSFPRTDPWRDRKGTGLAVTSVIRGCVVMREGEVIRERGGAFIDRRGESPG